MSIILTGLLRGGERKECCLLAFLFYHYKSFTKCSHTHHHLGFKEILAKGFKATIICLILGLDLIRQNPESHYPKRKDNRHLVNQVYFN